MFFFLGPLGGPIRKALGIPTLDIPGTSFDFYNVLDDPKPTSASNIACNLCLCLCCAMMVKNLMSFPFKTPPVLVCLAIACCCSSITTKNLYDELGVLQSEMFRANRLVVDTGIHHKKWTREKAMDYMKKTTGMSDTEVRVEIERYIVWPGQATSYKIGMLKILELREKAKNQLGEKFDLRDFHAIVLDHGIVPLFVLEDLIDEWIEESKD